MADEPFYSPRHTPPAPRQPRPGEVVWVLRNQGGRYRAEIRDDQAVGAGVELQLLRDDAFVYGQRFADRDAALAEAAHHRRELEAQGWA